jgi:DNA-binding transcriptional LysR family regulator
MGRLEEMQAFLRVAEARSFTQAARRLGLSKSVTSQRIADLEGRLGVRLITRTTRQLSLTEAGQAFFEHCARVVQEADEAEEAASRHGSELSGTIRIAASLSFTLLHLRPLVIEFMAAHPRVSVQLDLDDRVVDLVEGGYDLALRIGQLPDSSMVARRLAPVLNYCWAGPAYLAARGTPRFPAELTGHDCLIYSGGGTGRVDQWRFTTESGVLTVPVRGRLQSSNGDVLLSAAIAGFGVAQLPSFIAGPSFDAGALVRVLEEFPLPEGALHAIYPQGRHVPSRVRLLTEFLAERIGPEPYWDCRTRR